MTRRKKKIATASVAALCAAIVAIIIRQRLNPDKPLLPEDRQWIAELRSRANRAKTGVDDAQAKVLSGLLQKLEQRGYPSRQLSRILHRVLTSRLDTDTSPVAEHLVDALEGLAGEQGR